MNPETVHLVDRLYPEIRDDLLTALVGGVVNEPLLFDDKVDLYRLSQATRDVRSITGVATVPAPDGTKQQQRYTFQRVVDYEFSEGDNAIVWLQGGQLPDDNTVFYVDYFTQSSRSPLTDINVGSVSRTICEAIGREIAVVYQQINQAYRAGFIDTATGRSLDLVVAILGIKRKTKDAAVGQVTFFRDLAVEGSITLPEGALLSTAKGEATFVTTQLRTLQKGQVRIDVRVRATDKFSGTAGIVKTGEINTLMQPIAGVARVTNFEPTALGAEDETDEELRARAKVALRGAGKGTLAALAQVIFENRGLLAEAWDPNGPEAKQAPIGTVSLLIEAEPERFPSILTAVEQTRAAGVQTSLIARYIYFKLRMVVTLVPGLPAFAKPKVVEDVIAAIQGYVDSLESGQPVLGEKVLEAIASVKEIARDPATGKPLVKIAEVVTWRADVGQPRAANLADAILTAVQGVQPSDVEGQRTAITQVLNQEAPSLIPTGRRIPDRSLITKPSGETARDGDIETGQFQVQATLGSEKWWIVLDLEPADIVPVELGG